MSIETPIGSSLEYTTAKLNQVDAAVREFPEVAYTYGTVNTGYANGKNQASLYLRLKPIKERKRSPEQLAQPIRERLASIPGILVSINIPGGPGGGMNLRDGDDFDMGAEEPLGRDDSCGGTVDSCVGRSRGGHRLFREVDGYAAVLGHEPGAKTSGVCGDASRRLALRRQRDLVRP